MKHFTLFCLFLFALNCTLYSQINDYYYGIQTHFGQFYRADMDSVNMVKMLDSIQAAGIKVIRDECYWADVESTRGVFNFPSSIDNYINAANQRGIKIIMILDYNNPLYAPHAGSGVITDSNRTAFALYCQKVVERYSPLGVKVYEIWNEPNIPMFWHPEPNAVLYAQLLQTVYPAIKQVDSSVTIIGCSTSPAEGNPAPFIQWNTFITQVKNAGGLNYLDGVSFHIYRVDYAPETWIGNDITTLKSIIGANREIWLTESGYPTSSVWPNLTQSKQAQYITRLFLLGNNYPILKSIIYYDLKNEGEDGSNNEHNFGIMNFNLTPKPAYTAVKTLFTEIGGKSFSSAFSSGTLFKYSFENTTSKTNAFWTTSSTITKAELFGKSTLKITNIFGKSFYVFDEDKIFPVNYSESPQYITELNSLPVIHQYNLLPHIDEIVVGQKLNMKLTGEVSSGGTIFIDSTSVSWSVDDTLSVISSTGLLIAKYPGTTTVRSIFNSVVTTKQITILPSYNFLEVESFDSLQGFNYIFENLLPQSFLQIVDTNFTSPQNSLHMKYAFNYIGVEKHKVIFNCDYNLPGQPDSIMIDVYNNGQRHVIEFSFEDADGEYFRVNTIPNALLNKFGWNTLKAPINKFGSSFNYPVKLNKLTFYFVHNTNDSVNSGAVLLDNLRIHNGIISFFKWKNNLPDKFILHQNYPNPFNPTTTIKFSIPVLEISQSEKTQPKTILKLYDILGREIVELKNQITEPGEFEVNFDGRNYASGIYYCTLLIGNFMKSIKMILLK